MALSYSKEIKDKIKLHKVENPEYIAMADLMLLGWSEMDAFIVAVSPEMTMNKTFAENRIRSIINTPSFKQYMNDRSIAMGLSSAKSKPIGKKDGEIEIISKEKVLIELQRMYNLTPLSDQKTRTEILMKISDLQRYKDDIVESDANTKRYYMPKKCYTCSYYKGREKDKIK